MQVVVWGLTLLIAGQGLICAAERPGTISDPQALADNDHGFASREQRYRVQPGDLLEFQFRFTPEFNQTVRVQPDGYIPLEDAGELEVGGLTVREARDATAAAYRDKLNEPVINIILKEFTMPHFIVGGEVAKPGQYELRGDVMLSEAIQIAGGFRDGARTTEVLLFRRVSQDWVETKRINFKQAIRNDLEEDIALKPGDSVYVSRSKLGKVQQFMESSKLGLFFNPLSLF